MARCLQQSKILHDKRMFNIGRPVSLVKQPMLFNRYGTMLKFDNVEEGFIYIENKKYFLVEKINHNHKSRGGAIISMDSVELLTGKKYNKRMKSTDTLEIVELQEYSTTFKEYNEEDGSFLFEDDFGNEYTVNDERMWEDNYRLLKPGMKCRLKCHELDSGKIMPLLVKFDEDTFVLEVVNIREGEGTADRTRKAEIGDFGLIIKVPAHIEAGDFIRVSREANYLERVEDE